MLSIAVIEKLYPHFTHTFPQVLNAKTSCFFDFLFYKTAPLKLISKNFPRESFIADFSGNFTTPKSFFKKHRPFL